MSDQKHENAGEPRLRPVETMKANTGNGKLPGTKERKSGHCELQRTAWKSTVDIQFGQTRGTNKKGKRKEKTKKKERGEGERGEEKSKRERETDRMRGRERIRNRAELSRPRRLREARAFVVRSFVRSRGFRYCRKPPTSEPISTVADVTVIHRLFPDVRRECGTNGDGNRLRPEIISSLFELDVWPALFMKERGKEQRATRLSSLFDRQSPFGHVKSVMECARAMVRILWELLIPSSSPCTHENF